MSPFMLPQEFSLADVKAHNTEDDIYVAIHGKVYSVTSFVQEHPYVPLLKFCLYYLALY